MSDKVEKLVEEIENLTLLEMNELVKLLEEHFGVSATMIAPAQTAQATTETAAAEQSKVNVVLTDTGASKIQVIKALREINPNLGLKEAKDITDNPPQVIKEAVPTEEANKIKEKLEAAGAKVEYK
jgi:large subunit ribosomal protein L7/L12